MVDEGTSSASADWDEEEPLFEGGLRLALLRLKQPGSLEAAGARVPEGSWYLSTDPECHSLSRGLVLLAYRSERSLSLPWEEEAGAALVARIEATTGVEVPLDHSGPICRSVDRVRPMTGQDLHPLAERCAACPLARRRTRGGRRIADCQESYRLLLWDQGMDTPCVYRARGGALGPVRDFLTNIQVAARLHDLPLCGFQLGLSARRVRGERRSYFVPIFSRPYQHTDPQAHARYARLRDACAFGSAVDCA